MHIAHTGRALSLIGLSLIGLSTLTACSSMKPMPAMTLVDNASLPEAVRVPAGHRQVMSALGQGEITYECRARPGMPGAHEWAFVAPVATLTGPGGQVAGKYYGGPTWESVDGSRVTGKQVAVAPAAAGSIALQLVKADPAMGQGAMQGVSYIQRLNTQAGVAPTSPCDAARAGQRLPSRYQADYVFYAPA